MTARFTSVTALVHYRPTRPTTHAYYTMVYVQVLAPHHERRQARYTNVFSQALCKSRAFTDDPRRNIRYTNVYAQVFATRTPDFTWIDDMFVNEVFPFDISYESTGTTKFATDVILVDSGNDQRVARWDQPLMEYDISYGVRTMEQLHALIAFFRVMRGRKYGFLYDDYVDNRSTLAKRIEARASDKPSFRDQVIGIGDDNTYVFQLIKTYPAPSGQNSFRRLIQKPKKGSVKIGLGGLPVENYTVDHDKGLVTFTPPLVFPPHQMSLYKNGGIISVKSGQPGFFTGLKTGHRIVMGGWINPQNNFSYAQQAHVRGVYDQNGSFDADVGSGIGSQEVNSPHPFVQVHPAPQPGVIISAGYGFYVPVRFDVDTLPVSLQDYGVGSASSIKLVELRPAETVPVNGIF